MRRGLKVGQTRPEIGSNHMSRDLDWLVDKWSESSPEVKLQLVLAKIRAEGKKTADENRRAV